MNRLHLARGMRWCLAPVVVGTLLLASTAPSAAQITVCIEPADTAIALGDLVTMRVTCDGPPSDLKGYLARLTYDPAILLPVSTTPGSVLGSHLYSFFPYLSPPDTVGFDAAVLIGATNGPGTLGYITFQGIAAGASDLDLTEVLMRNSLNQPYPVVLCGGRVRVLGPVPVLPTTWSRIKTRE